MPKKLWRLVNRDEEMPKAKDAEKPTVKKLQEQDEWSDRAQQAAGELYLAISDEQKIHLEEIVEDPVQIWTKLKYVHLQERPIACFSAWEQMKPDESLSTLMTRINAAIVRVHNELN